MLDRNLPFTDNSEGEYILSDYHMKLHYSQTCAIPFYRAIQFDYHMKLHYSQTTLICMIEYLLFDYHMKLHYSQTTSSLQTM